MTVTLPFLIWFAFGVVIGAIVVIGIYRYYYGFPAK